MTKPNPAQLANALATRVKELQAVKYLIEQTEQEPFPDPSEAARGGIGDAKAAIDRAVNRLELAIDELNKACALRVQCPRCQSANCESITIQPYRRQRHLHQPQPGFRCLDCKATWSI